ncbi:MAG TPA: BON domain-containing protein [Pyrinomonadaceae bacterium]|jgi:hypothetical protein|nr:BON domain-containing protein [Pyrinomonadaceae bacterium]
MHKSRIAALAAGTALAALAAGCSNTANTNTTNGTNGNSNVAVVTNANNTNLSVNTNRATNANVSYNANMTREDYEKNKESYSADAKRAGSTIGSGANDAWLWTKTRAALSAADDLRDSTINVDVDNAVVTLRGTVADGKQKIRAVDVAKKVDGVKSVTNKLTVKGEGDAAGNTNANKKG